MTARPIPIAAGTRTGLKRRKSGVATARPTIDPTNVRPDRSSRVPPRGRRAMTARILEADGPFCSSRSAMVICTETERNGFGEGERWSGGRYKEEGDRKSGDRCWRRW